MSRLLAAAVALSLSCSMAIPVNAATLRPRSGAYELQVLVDGQPVRAFPHNGDTWLLGQLGARYTLRVINRSSRPIEAVVSVDGRDVIDGDTASPQKGGYLVPAYGTVDIDGWRISSMQAAAFRFSAVSDSYAARVGSGREVGVIGVAVFEEKRRPPPPPRSISPRDEGYSCCAGGKDAHAENGPYPTAMPPPVAAVPAPMPAKQRAQADDADLAPPVESMRESAGAPASAPPSDLSLNSMDSAASAGAGGSAMAEPQMKKARQRSGLGTEYGEAVNSQIHQVQFERATSMPRCYLGVHYNDHDGLVAMGIDVDGVGEEALRQSANPFPVVERQYAPPPPNWRE